MCSIRGFRWPLAAAALALVTLLLPAVAMAHCDGLDGPVVTAARQALEKGDPAGVLAWVQPADEAAIRAAFARALAVRRQGPQARELADTWFFETLVRVHRAGEGAPYTGLKPAGRDMGPAIPATDAALESGNVDPLLKLVLAAVERGVRERFEEARAARAHANESVSAGRTYVGAYVPFLHYVERLYTDATTSPEGHEAEAKAGTAPHAHED